MKKLKTRHMPTRRKPLRRDQKRPMKVARDRDDGAAGFRTADEALLFSRYLAANLAATVARMPPDVQAEYSALETEGLDHPRRAELEQLYAPPEQDTEAVWAQVAQELEQERRHAGRPTEEGLVADLNKAAELTQAAIVSRLADSERQEYEAVVAASEADMATEADHQRHQELLKRYMGRWSQDIFYELATKGVHMEQIHARYGSIMGNGGHLNLIYSSGWDDVPSQRA